jgi:dTMP kinase
VANQLSLLSVYGAVPVAALLFALLNTASRFFADPRNADPEVAEVLGDSRVPIMIALSFNAASFLVSAATIFFSRRLIPASTGEREKSAGLLELIKEGVSFLRTNALMKALFVGILGAFAAGGFVIGVAQLWVVTLAAGTAGYSILFGTVFSGLALGMLLGPRLLPGITRRRIFGVSIGLAGMVLLVMSFMREFVIAATMAGAVGFFSGVAWIVGYTLIGYEVVDRLRGRTFAFVISSVRIMLLLTVAIGPLMAGFLGNHVVTVGQTQLVFTGPGLTLLIAGVLAIGVSAYVSRRVAPGQRSVLTAAVRKLFGAAPLAPDEPPGRGFLCAVEGPDPAERRRVTTGLVEWLAAQGHDVVLTGRIEERAAAGRFSESAGPGATGARSWRHRGHRWISRRRTNTQRPRGCCGHDRTDAGSALGQWAPRTASDRGVGRRRCPARRPAPAPDRSCSSGAGQVCGRSRRARDAGAAGNAAGPDAGCPEYLRDRGPVGHRPEGR